MDPVAFEIGPLAVRWYGILIGTGVIIAFILALREGKKRGFDEELFYDLIIFGVPAGIIGARLYYVLFSWEVYADNPISALYIWQGGLAIHGAIIAGVLVGIIICKRYGVNFWDIADIAAPSFAIAQSIGRWGNFVNQEAYGYKTDLPWAMYIDGAYRDPTFLYESIWDFSIFLFLLWLRRRDYIKSGEVFLSYLGLYSLGRFFIEGLRTDSLWWGQFRVAQLISVVLILGSIGLGVYRRKKGLAKEPAKCSK